jgi:divinyl protochlorophyllide a 8-vinyl-reductase
MTAAVTAGSSHHIGMIGPNAITRIVEALVLLESRQSAVRIFRASKLEAYLSVRPTEMVDEQEVMRLHRVLCDDLGANRARAVSRTAGRLTADYLLHRRIPRLAQMALRCCPDGIASRMLAKAIAKNAWTFAGTGTFSARHGHPTLFTLRNCPISRGRRSAEPCCDFYAATFERLYRRLVNDRARVVEVGCEATGSPACTFRIDW